MIRLGWALLGPLIAAAPALAADDETRWTPIEPDSRKVEWPAESLAAMPHLAEGFSGPLGYRVERYFWRAQQPGGAFAIVVLRDLRGDDHYLSGPVDLMKFAATVLKGLEAPGPQALEPKDRIAATASGMAATRRFELGARQCVAAGLYAGPDGKGSSKETPLSEGPIRLDGVYCATAGEKMSEARAATTVSALRIGEPEMPQATVRLKK